MSTSKDEILKNMFVASTCVATVVAAFNPLDCYRIRWQVQKIHSCMTNHGKSILKNEGLFRGLWMPGLFVNITAAATSRGIGIGCYPTLRDAIAPEKNPFTMFLAGTISGAAGYSVSTPLWQLKIILQAQKEGSKIYSNTFDGLRKLSRGGISTLYKGSIVLVVRGGMMNGGNFLGYDSVKTWNKSREMVAEGPVVHFVASVFAAFLSATFSCPADLVLTRYQAAKQMGREYSGVGHCVRSLVKNEGLMCLFKGWSPLFIRIAPIYVIYFPAYEQMRKALGMEFLN